MDLKDINEEINKLKLSEKDSDQMRQMALLGLESAISQAKRSVNKAKNIHQDSSYVLALQELLVELMAMSLRVKQGLKTHEIEPGEKP